jgi:DHA1 family bicyclomycin/chloramphenicol resistance-like MFS transporter
MEVMTSLRTVWLCAALAGLGPLSMSLYTPVMPEMVVALASSTQAVKLTLTCYLLAFAVGQLVAGALADSWGRRPVAIGFLSIYLVGTLVCLLSNTVGGLVLGRLLQGTGAAAGVVLARAVVRDQFEGQQAAKLINSTSLILITAPTVAPAVGGLLSQSWGWRAVFVLMLALCLLVLSVVALWMKETWTGNAAMLPARTATYWRLVRNSEFMLPALSVAAVTGGVYTLSALLPFVMLGKFGLSPTEYGLSMVSQAGAFGVGSWAASRLLKRFEAGRLSYFGSLLVAIAGLTFALQGEVAHASAFSLMASLALWAFGNALMNPGLIARALQGSKENAGAASALLGFMQIGMGFAGSAAAALLFTDALVATAWAMPVAAALSSAFHVKLARQGSRR